MIFSTLEHLNFQCLSVSIHGFITLRKISMSNICPCIEVYSLRTTDYYLNINKPLGTTIVTSVAFVTLRTDTDTASGLD